MNWYNEPPSWSSQGNIIAMQTGPHTDFWRITSYGFSRDNGHIYYQSQQGNFLAEVKVSGQYTALYDQAGLMVRASESEWIKCGIEFFDGVQHVSAVVTREYSDWSLGPTLLDNPNSLWLRLKREGDAVEITYALDGTNYQLLRLAYLAPTETLDIGLMCASPEGPGFSVTFENFVVQSI
ncbi:MAG TPA: DUF1349 domain-containing protein [Ktedonobacteraceae bacterium]|jgi:hypothetical protein